MHCIHVYEELFISLFVSGYLAILDNVKPALKPPMTKHPKELMGDVELYGWVPVRAYHAVWLQQIENGQARWDDAHTKLEFCHALVWHPALNSTRLKAVPTIEPHKKRGKEGTATILCSLQ